MLLLGCSKSILLLLSCSELLNSQGIRSLEQLGWMTKNTKIIICGANIQLYVLIDRFCFCFFFSNQPAVEGCSQTTLLEPLRSPPEFGSLHSQTGATQHQLAAPYLPCSGPPGSGSRHLGLCFGLGCVAGVHEGGAVRSSPRSSDWHPSFPRLQLGKLDGFQVLDWESKDVKT